jgi:predicted nucleic acid-binding protein
VTSPVPRRAYLDTSLLVPYALGPTDSNFQRSRGIFGEAEKGKLKLIVSHFALQETLHTLRRLKLEDVIRRSGLRQRQKLIEFVNGKEFLEDAKKKSWEAFRRIVEQVTADELHFEVDGEEEYDSQLFVKGLESLTKTFGSVRIYPDNCQFCSDNMECLQCGNEARIHYKAINAPDLTHTFIAISLGCDEILTADKGFKELQNQALPIKITVFE